MAARGHAGRFRRGRGGAGGRENQGALPGGVVSVFEQALRGRVAWRERAMRVRGIGRDLRAYRPGSDGVGDG